MIACSFFQFDVLTTIGGSPARLNGVQDVFFSSALKPPQTKAIAQQQSFGGSSVVYLVKSWAMDFPRLSVLRREGRERTARIWKTDALKESYFACAVSFMKNSRGGDYEEK